jgi:hypothetical protein
VRFSLCLKISLKEALPNNGVGRVDKSWRPGDYLCRDEGLRHCASGGDVTLVILKAKKESDFFV